MAQEQVERIARRLAQVQERIASAARRSGRASSEITLVGVTKTRTVAEIEAACLAGLMDLGENRVEEAETKKPDLDRGGLCRGITWHLVGHLQSRKARRAIEVFDIVHSVDSVKLARKLSALAGEEGRVLPVLVEVNASGEESKYGFPLSDRAGLDAARLNVRLATELSEGPAKLANAQWVLGAQLLAAGEYAGAVEAFRQCEAKGAEAQDRSLELLGSGYAGVAMTIAGQEEGQALLDAAIEGFQELGTEDSEFFVQQLRTALKVFAGEE